MGMGARKWYGRSELKWQVQAMQDHKSLRAWQEAHAVTLGVLRLSRDSWKPYAAALFGQLQRSSLSVELNIAEGYSFGNTPTYTRHLGIAYGSAVETIELLSIGMEAEVLPSLTGGKRGHATRRECTPTPPEPSQVPQAIPRMDLDPGKKEERKHTPPSPLTSSLFALRLSRFSGYGPTTLGRKSGPSITLTSTRRKVSGSTTTRPVPIAWRTSRPAVESPRRTITLVESAAASAFP